MRALLVLSLLALGAPGCSKAGSEDRAVATAEPRVAEISIEELATLLATRACRPVDANGDRTRKKLGVIPGAVLLSDYETYLPSELPADRTTPLVFYCANTSCGASHDAALRAMIAGYTDVKVLPEGIAGWVKAGKPIQAL